MCLSGHENKPNENTGTEVAVHRSGTELRHHLPCYKDLLAELWAKTQVKIMHSYACEKLKEDGW